MYDIEEPEATSGLARALLYLGPRGEPLAFRLAGRARIAIGRGSSCDLVIRDHRISRLHATIELVHGQHLLRDARSSNGTYLNGLRIATGSAFALRPGDAIEIGADRLTYDMERPGATPLPSGMQRHALADLLADGEKELSPAEQARIDAAVERALAGVPLERGLHAALGLVVDRVVVSLVGLYLEDERGELRAVAGRPSPATARILLGLATSAVRAGEGRLLVGVVPLDDPGSSDDTADEGEACSAAVPFLAGARRGAIAAQRSVGARLDIRALAALAIIGRSVGRLVATPIVFVAPEHGR